jgi:3'-phosphoadenosine 5'-phosphosulfate sulfotransferase (PAPS reductase)/FAD synthetase
MTRLRLFSFSAGKDSTAELIIAKKQGIPIDRVVFVDMQDADFPEVKQHVEKVQNYIGREIEIIKAPFTFDEKFFQPVKTGNHIRPYRGFPPTVGCACWIKRDLKVTPVNRWIRANDLSGYIQHFGFAKGEEHRLARQPNGVSLLIENGVTEQKAREICEAEGLLLPLYKFFDRIGCWFCPKKSLKSWRSLWLNFPELWQKVKYYEKFCIWKITPKYTTDEMEQRFLRETEVEKTRQAATPVLLL